MSDEPVVALSSSAASASDVVSVAASKRRDMSLVENVDPTDVMISTDRKKPFVMHRSRPNETFAITLENMYVEWAKLTGEGNLGHSFTYLNKLTNPSDDNRHKAEFELPLTVGGRDMDAVTATRTDLLPNQMAGFAAVYASAVNMLTYGFNNPATVGGIDIHVNKALEAAYNAEIDFDARNAELTKTPPKYASTDDVKLAADADKELAARIRAAQLKIFIAGATKPDNPALYDEEGVKKRTRQTLASEKPKKFKLNLGRKVYKFTGVYDKQTNPKLPAFTPGFVLTKENWPELLEKIENVVPDSVPIAGEKPKEKDKYIYNTFAYVDANTGNIIPHPMYKPPGSTKEIIDITWSALKNCVALVSVKVTFQVYATAGMYGVTIFPDKQIWIVRRAKRMNKNEPLPVDLALAMPYEEFDNDDDDDAAKMIAAAPKRLAIKPNDVD